MIIFLYVLEVFNTLFIFKKQQKNDTKKWLFFQKGGNLWVHPFRLPALGA
jgi:hypothetical protein